MPKIRLAINGFGRIGRASFKVALEKDDIEVIAINDLTNPRVLAHLLKYDTAYGVYPHEIWVEEDGKRVGLDEFRGEKEFYTKSGKVNLLVIGDEHGQNAVKVMVLSEKDPVKLPWSALDIDVVLECTGRFIENDAAAAHITAGAKKVVVSAPTKGGTTETFLFGANQDKYAGQKIISNASCTANSISPVVSVVHKEFGILKSVMTTVHGVTAGQNLVDGPPNALKPDLRRARAAPWNIIPTTTGAAKATTLAIPDLKDKFDGLAVRVPVIAGSLSDITMLVARKTTVEEVNTALIDASKKTFYKNYLGVTWEPIVSSDVIGTTYSSLVDLNMTRVVDGDLVKVLAWYDNEWGYSNRLVEMGILAGLSG